MDELKPAKYGSVNYGAETTPRGNLLKIKDVIKALEYILDDDCHSEVMHKLVKLLAYLEEEIE